MFHDPYHHDFLQQYFYISSALARGGKGGYTWPIDKAYVALNFGLLELSSP
jgi:hypothetical protein